MKNEFGAQLDRNGYAPSIIQTSGGCYLCRGNGGGKLDRHEPWGAANRQKSKEYGLWVNLCHLGCHEGPGSVHDDAALAREQRKDAQRAAMLRYGWSREEWIARFGKSELSEEEAAHLIILPEKEPEEKKEQGAGGTDFARARQIIERLYPNRRPVSRNFRLLDDAEMPF